MPEVDFGAEHRIEIEAPPEHVWNVVSDVTRTPEWSPVCRRVEWLAPWSAPTVGARFVGHNVRGLFRWSRECEITACEPGRQLAFRTLFQDQESTRWDYRFSPSGSGTDVVEHYEAVLLPRWVRFLRLLPGATKTTRRQAHENISTSIANLKRIAEAEATG